MPYKRPHFIFGSVTRQNIFQPLAPSDKAASSSLFPCACITGINSRATNGKVTKIVAIIIGASGVAIVGAFANFIAIILAFANGAINNGIVKYSSEYKSDEQKSKELFSTSFRISLFQEFSPS